MDNNTLRSLPKWGQTVLGSVAIVIGTFSLEIGRRCFKLVVDTIEKGK